MFTRLMYRAARFIKQDYARNSIVSLDPLSERRKAHRLNYFYPATNGSFALPIPGYTRNLRALLDVIQIILLFSPKRDAITTFQVTLHSYFRRTIKDWNSMPTQTRAQSYNVL